MHKKYYATGAEMLQDLEGKFLVHMVAGCDLENKMLPTGGERGKDYENIVIFYIEDDGSVPTPQPPTPELQALIDDLDDEEQLGRPWKWRPWETIKSISMALKEGRGCVVRDNLRGTIEGTVASPAQDKIVTFAPIPFAAMLAICEQSFKNDGIHSYDAIRMLSTSHDYMGTVSMPIKNNGFYEVRYAVESWSNAPVLVKTESRDELIHWASNQQGVCWTPRW